MYVWTRRVIFIAHCCMSSLRSENGLNRENASITFFKKDEIKFRDIFSCEETRC